MAKVIFYILAWALYIAAFICLIIGMVKWDMMYLICFLVLDELGKQTAHIFQDL